VRRSGFGVDRHVVGHSGFRVHNRNMKRFRGGLVLKAHRLCVSLNSRLDSNNEEEVEGYVVGLEIAVEDAEVVEVGERVCQLPQPAPHHLSFCKYVELLHKFRCQAHREGSRKI